MHQKSGSNKNGTHLGFTGYEFEDIAIAAIVLSIYNAAEDILPQLLAEE